MKVTYDHHKGRMALPHCICNILCIWRNLYFYLYCICIASGLSHASSYGVTRIAYYEAGKASVGRGSWAFGGAQKNPTSLLYASTHSRTQINQCALSSRTSCECRFIFATPPGLLRAASSYDGGATASTAVELFVHVSTCKEDESISLHLVGIVDGPTTAYIPMRNLNYIGAVRQWLICLKLL